MNRYHKNPRRISEQRFSDLQRWLREFGDLSGIVHDEGSDEVVTGNQRVRALDIGQCEIVLTQELEQPDAQGTTAMGYVVWEGNRYNYRRVRWTPEQCEQANIIANRAGGAWDFDVLTAEFDMGDLLDWGFTEADFAIDGDGRAEFSFLQDMAEEEPAEGDDGGKGAGEGPAGYPLAIVLQFEELARWHTWKAERGLRDDRDAFLAMLGEVGG